MRSIHSYTKLTYILHSFLSFYVLALYVLYLFMHYYLRCNHLYVTVIYALHLFIYHTHLCVIFVHALHSSMCRTHLSIAFIYASYLFIYCTHFMHHIHSMILYSCIVFLHVLLCICVTLNLSFYVSAMQLAVSLLRSSP